MVTDRAVYFSPRNLDLFKSLGTDAERRFASSSAPTCLMNKLKRGRYFGCLKETCMQLQVVSDEEVSLEVFEAGKSELSFFPSMKYDFKDCRIKIPAASSGGLKYKLTAGSMSEIS